MYTIMCFVLILSVSVANVSVRDCTSCGDENGYFENVRATEVTRSVFTFGYQQGDVLAMRIYIKNKAVNVNTQIYFTNNYFSGEEQEKELQEPTAGDYIRIRRLLSFRDFVIDVVLSTEKGFCFTKRIVEARDVSFRSTEINQKEYNDICLRSHWCEVEVDLEYMCRDFSIGKETKKKRKRRPKTWRPKSYYETFYINRTFIPTYPKSTTWSRKEKDSIIITTSETTASHHDPSTYDTDNQKIEKTTLRPARDQHICKTNTFAPTYSATATASHIETTSKEIATISKAQTSTGSTNYGLIISSSVAAVALILIILLVVIAIRTHCWAKPRPPPQLPTCENLYQIPQNPPLQNETEYEYESVYKEEEHIYEEINYALCQYRRKDDTCTILPTQRK